MAKKKLTKKQKRRLLKLALICLAFLLVLSVPVGLIIYFTNNNNNNYEIVDRVKHIKREKKRDSEGINTIGWLRVQGTNIDTPIVTYKNIETLDNIQKDDFLWNESKKEELYNRVNIQGHNILNLSSSPEINQEYFTKFEDLMGFIYYDFAKENQHIQYTINGKNYIYKVFAVYFAEKYELDIYHDGNYEQNDIKKFITDSKERSLYDYDIDVENDSNIITLITCSRLYGVNDSRQFVVVGKMLEENTKIESSPIKEKKSYDEIKKLMKGELTDVEA